VDPDRLQKVLAGERSLPSIKKRNQACIRPWSAQPGFRWKQ
jgi:hypothetical protein